MSIIDTRAVQLCELDKRIATAPSPTFGLIRERAALQRQLTAELDEFTKLTLPWTYVPPTWKP
jgi:hypothetical protein